MTGRHLLTLFAVTLVASCGEKPKTKFDTPEAAFAEIKAACAERNAGRLYDMCSAMDRREFQQGKEAAESARIGLTQLMKILDATEEEIRAMDLRTYSLKLLTALFDHDGRRVLKHVAMASLVGDPNSSGDECVLSWKTDEGLDGQTALSREGGEWRVVLGKLYIPSAETLNRQRLGAKTQDRLECMNKLRLLGSLLVVRKTMGKPVTRYSGPAFLLQVAGEIDDGDLETFVCWSEPMADRSPRPGLVSPDFARRYREMNLDEVTDWNCYSSYAGANWKDYPDDPTSREARIWACCPHHDGVTVLWDSSKVTFIEAEELKRGGPDGDEIILGPDSPDPRLRKVTFSGGR